jgi:DNA-binding CsgD family transcriptional regulator
MTDDRIARLTDSQRAYLRLVLAHRSSKEIAQEFDISAHTVDKRIKEAMRILGVATRIDAARILSLAEEPGPGRELGPQSPDLVSSRNSAADMPSIFEGTGTGGYSTVDDRQMAGSRLEDGDSVPLPFPLFARPRRSLSLWQRAGWMIGLIIGLALATGILLSGLMAVSALLNPMTR